MRKSLFFLLLLAIFVSAAAADLQFGITSITDPQTNKFYIIKKAEAGATLSMPIEFVNKTGSRISLTSVSLYLYFNKEYIGAVNNIENKTDLNVIESDFFSTPGRATLILKESGRSIPVDINQKIVLATINFSVSQNLPNSGVSLRPFNWIPTLILQKIKVKKSTVLGTAVFDTAPNDKTGLLVKPRAMIFESAEPPIYGGVGSVTSRNKLGVLNFGGSLVVTCNPATDNTPPITYQYWRKSEDNPVWAQIAQLSETAFFDENLKQEKGSWNTTARIWIIWGCWPCFA